MCAGDETCGGLKMVLGDMIRIGSLADTVTVPDAGTLDVRWHLCSDHKLVALVAGMGESGCISHAFCATGTAGALLQSLRSRDVKIAIWFFI
jgi:hypothetical protein